MKISEIKITYSSKSKHKIKISSSKDAYDLLLDHWDKSTLELRESFKVLYLNRGNTVIGIEHHSVGGITGTIADVKLIIATALKCVASSIILSHNHPSGNLVPSQADKKLTNKIQEASKLFDISLLDHLIVTKEGYYSFCDENLI